MKKIGFSAYDIKDVKKIINSFEFDILQFPFNIFDQRLLNKKLLKNLKDKNRNSYKINFFTRLITNE